MSRFHKLLNLGDLMLNTVDVVVLEATSLLGGRLFDKRLIGRPRARHCVGWGRQGESGCSGKSCCWMVRGMFPGGHGLINNDRSM